MTEPPHVVDLVLKKHNITIQEWLQAVLRTAPGTKVKLLPHSTNYTALRLNEQDAKILGETCLGKRESSVPYYSRYIRYSLL